MTDDSFIGVVLGFIVLMTVSFILGIGCGGSTSAEERRRAYIEGVNAACAPAKPLLSTDGKFSRCAP